MIAKLSTRSFLPTHRSSASSLHDDAYKMVSLYAREYSWDCCPISRIKSHTFLLPLSHPKRLGNSKCADT